MRLSRWLMIRSSLNCSNSSRLLEKAHICSLISESTSVRSLTPRHSRTFSMKVMTSVRFMAVFCWLLKTTRKTSFSCAIPYSGRLIPRYPPSPASDGTGERTAMRSKFKTRSIWEESMGLSASSAVMARSKVSSRELSSGLILMRACS